MIRRRDFGPSHRALGGLLLVVIGTGDMAMAQTTSRTTTTTTTTTAAGAVATEPMTQTETLVSRFALYPDDLVALVIPAATYPLQVVDAARYLDKRKADPKLPLPESWDDSVKSLANYPDVIKMMNDDLAWTQALNDAIVTDQAAVLDAIQTYRRKVMAAGNLKTDQKQVVTVEQEVVSIAPADPQVIYVPQYQPATMVVYGGYSGWGYYGTPYPSYYYPYAPGAALATGLIWGAAIGAAWNGGRYGYWGGNNNINIDRGDINIDRGDRNTINSGNRGQNAGNRGQGGGRGQAWQPSNKASTAGGGRIGDPGARAGASAGSLDRAFGPSTGASSRDRAGTYGPQAGGSRDRAGGGSYGAQAGGSRDRAAGGAYGGNRGASSYGGSRNAFGSGGSGGYGSRSSASSFSARGASSRGFSGGGGRRR